MTPISRRRALAYLAMPIAGFGAKLADKVDPEGAVVEEGAPLLVVNAPNTVINNVSLTSGVPRRSAIQVRSGSHDTAIWNSRIAQR